MGALGEFIGSLAVMATDPGVFIVALLAGLGCRTWRRFAVIAPAVAVLDHAAVNALVWSWRVELGSNETYAELLARHAPARLIAFLAIAAIAAAAARRLIDKRRRRDGDNPD